MARAALGWSVRDLEAKSGVRRNTISRYESATTILASASPASKRRWSIRGSFFFEGTRLYGTGVGLKKAKAQKR
jgi:transcriptional regulator with XRE-family HTH domain